MASADFCTFSTTLRPWLRLSAHSVQTSPGTTRFFPSIYLPHLPHAIPCSYWASTWFAALPSHIAFYAVSVRQARGLPVVSLFPHPASFRFRLATDTLAFGYLLPTTGRIRGFHPLETCAAGRTKQNPSPFGLGFLEIRFSSRDARPEWAGSLHAPQRCVSQSSRLPQSRR